VSTHSIAATAEQASIFEVVKLVDTELHDLLARREEINSRIQNLHQVIHGLREVVRVPALVASKPATNESVQRQENIASAGRGKPSLLSEKRIALSQNQIRLARACRIALMEAEGAASLEEIYSRIVRRDSFSFINFELAAPALLRVLNAMSMVGDRDICCLNDGSRRRWGRVTKTAQEVPSSSL
jgi:hypothetical protein